MAIAIRTPTRKGALGNEVIFCTLFEETDIVTDKDPTPPSLSRVSRKWGLQRRPPAPPPWPYIRQVDGLKAERECGAARAQ